jgi:hypothetical protein
MFSGCTRAVFDRPASHHRSGSRLGFFDSHTMLRQSFIDELNSVPEMTWKAAMPGRFVGMPIGASKDMYVPRAIGESFGPAAAVNCTGLFGLP